MGGVRTEASGPCSLLSPGEGGASAAHPAQPCSPTQPCSPRLLLRLALDLLSSPCGRGHPGRGWVGGGLAGPGWGCDGGTRPPSFPAPHSLSVGGLGCPGQPICFLLLGEGRPTLAPGTEAPRRLPGRPLRAKSGHCPEGGKGRAACRGPAMPSPAEPQLLPPIHCPSRPGCFVLCHAQGGPASSPGPSALISFPDVGPVRTAASPTGTGDHTLSPSETPASRSSAFLETGLGLLS